MTLVVHMRSLRLGPLPLWLMWIRVGGGPRLWSLVTPWGVVQ